MSFLPRINHLFIKWLLLACLLGTANSVWAKAFVWKVSKDNRVVYLGGAIHLLAQSDYPLPKEYEFAYQSSKALVFEVDLRQTQTPSFQQHLLMQMRYPYGETLQQHLSPSVYKKLTSQLKSYGVDINKIRNYRASLMSMNLTLLEMKRLGLAGTGVDKYFLEKAIQHQKPILALETPKQHLLFMSSMGEGHENAMILHTLEENTHLGQIMRSMKQFWRAGDVAGFDRTVLKPFETDFPSIYHAIIVERNQNWLPKIEYMIHTPPTEFILVGTLHLVGKHGLLEQLKRKGYQVQQLDFKPPKPS
ncbi:MAG: TraB/GumN family protein [Thiotrichales bacterium]|nr:TraB/GumN family protein [Thiotrichales bacterium]